MKEPRNYFLLQFAPENWTALHKLGLFLGSANGLVRGGLRDCGKHLERASVYQRIAKRLRPNLHLDREELEKYGGTDGLNSREYAATCEAVVATLYSALDGLRAFLFGMYRDVQRVQNGSNGKLFERAKKQEYGVGFPLEVQNLLSEAWDTWFLPFREFRTELTHGSTGSCHLDQNTDVIRYFNDGIVKDGKAFMLDDIDGYILDVNTQIRTLVEEIAAYHFNRLEPTPTFAMCGTYKARWYGRMVAPSRDLSFNSGHCLSYDWFEVQEGYFCPLADKCEAYSRKWPGGSAKECGGG